MLTFSRKNRPQPSQASGGHSKQTDSQRDITCFDRLVSEPTAAEDAWLGNPADPFFFGDAEVAGTAAGRQQRAQAGHGGGCRPVSSAKLVAAGRWGPIPAEKTVELTPAGAATGAACQGDTAPPAARLPSPLLRRKRPSSSLAHEHPPPPAPQQQRQQQQEQEEEDEEEGAGQPEEAAEQANKRQRQQGDSKGPVFTATSGAPIGHQRPVCSHPTALAGIGAPGPATGTPGRGPRQAHCEEQQQQDLPHRPSSQRSSPAQRRTVAEPAGAQAVAEEAIAPPGNRWQVGRLARIASMNGGSTHREEQQIEWAGETAVPVEASVARADGSAIPAAAAATAGGGRGAAGLPPKSAGRSSGRAKLGAAAKRPARAVPEPAAVEAAQEPGVLGSSRGTPPAGLPAAVARLLQPGAAAAAAASTAVRDQAAATTVMGAQVGSVCAWSHSVSCGCGSEDSARMPGFPSTLHLQLHVAQLARLCCLPTVYPVFAGGWRAAAVHGQRLVCPGWLGQQRRPHPAGIRCAQPCRAAVLHLSLP